MKKRYKWTANNGPIYGLKFLGMYAKPGKWMSVDGPLVFCKNGFHVLRREQVPWWRGTELWEVEVEGENIIGKQKECWQRMRLIRRLPGWNKQTMVDCTETDAAVARITDTFRAEIAANAAAAYGSSITTAVTIAINVADAAADAAADSAAAAAAAAAAASTPLVVAINTLAKTIAALAAYKKERLRQLEWIENHVGKLT